MYYHQSDVVYFVALTWRRSGIFVADWNAGVPDNLTRLVERICVLDFRLHGLPGPQKYTVNVYRDKSMRMELTPAERYEKHLALTTAFDIQH